MSFHSKLEGYKESSATDWDFIGDYVGLDGARALASCLVQNVPIQKLDLSNNNLGTEECRVLAEALGRNTTLQVLNLGSNNLGAEGVRLLAEGLKGNSTLMKLVLRYNDVGVDGARALAEWLTTNRGLRALNLSDNDIGMAGTKLLAHSLVQNHTLRALNLGDNAIGVAGLKALGEALQLNTTLHKLDLRYNNLGPEGAKLLADLIAQDTALRTLNLTGNNFTAEGAAMLAEGLRRNTSLRELFVSSNELGPEGAQALAATLRNNSTLRELCVSRNNVGAEGGRALADALKENRALREMDVRCNGAPEEVLNDIGTLLQRNRTHPKHDLHEGAAPATEVPAAAAPTATRSSPAGHAIPPLLAAEREAPRRPSNPAEERRESPSDDETPQLMQGTTEFHAPVQREEERREERAPLTMVDGRCPGSARSFLSTRSASTTQDTHSPTNVPVGAERRECSSLPRSRPTSRRGSSQGKAASGGMEVREPVSGHPTPAAMHPGHQRPVSACSCPSRLASSIESSVTPDGQDLPLDQCELEHRLALPSPSNSANGSRSGSLSSRMSPQAVSTLGDDEEDRPNRGVQRRSEGSVASPQSAWGSQKSTPASRRKPEKNSGDAAPGKDPHRERREAGAATPSLPPRSPTPPKQGVATPTSTLAVVKSGVQVFSERMMESDDLDPHGIDPPILTSFLDDFPLLSLEEALKSLEGFQYRVTEEEMTTTLTVNLPALLREAKACKVLGRKKVLEKPSLQSSDGIASIRLYTMPTMYQVVRSGLCDAERDRESLRPLGCYLKLLLTALRSLPPEYHHRGTVYRGVRGHPTYRTGRMFIHWGFSSCTSNAAMLQTFSQRHGKRIAFKLEVQSMAYCIAEFSQACSEQEVLLEPMACFSVRAVTDFDALSDVLPRTGVMHTQGLRVVEAAQEVEDSLALQL